MSKTAFAQAIITKLRSAIGNDGGNYTAGTASVAMSAVAAAITEYIITNTSVTISYSGIIPSTPPVTDPLVTDTFEIVGSCAPTGPSDSFDTWIKQIESNIIAGFTLAPQGKAGVVFVQRPFLSPGISTLQSMLKANHNVADENPQQKIWEIICGDIMDWINGAAMNPTPGAATHNPPGSSGIAQITKIIIS